LPVKLPGHFSVAARWVRSNVKKTAKRLNSIMNMKRIIFAGLFLALAAVPSQVWADDAADAATVKNNQAYFAQGDQLKPLTENLKFSSDVEVDTNGDFQIANGKKRSLQDGQLLRRDGWLVNPDGSVEPVFDHLAMKAGKVIIVRDGQAETVTETITLPNKFSVNPDGSCVYPDGGHTRLADGQLFRLDGTPIIAKDTVTFKNGQVVVQKQGSLIPLSPVQIMGMNDGTRVYGDGSIEPSGGARTKLRDGQTILVNGVSVQH
jgi:hypothetical protein